MKRVLYTIAIWIKSLFAKKTKPQEQPLPIYDVVGIDEVVPWWREKKQILKNFNDKNTIETLLEDNKIVEYKEVLKETYKKEKFTKNKKENKVIIINDKEYNLTKKQHFFWVNALGIYHLIDLEIDEQKDYLLKPIDMNEVCKRFIDLKFGADKIQQDIMYKPSYHKKTINYLVKVGLFKKIGQNTYKVLCHGVFF